MIYWLGLNCWLTLAKSFIIKRWACFSKNNQIARANIWLIIGTTVWRVMPILFGNTFICQLNILHTLLDIKITSFIR